MAALKVYRTTIGFHDAYVAAPSQTAALKAWGSDHNLFARKMAEVVTDPALAAEPLSSPGTVIKRLRGTLAEQIAALPPDDRRRTKRAASPQSTSGSTRQPEVPAEPRPSRASLDTAEGAVGAAKKAFAAELADLARREAQLASERRAIERKQEKELAELNDRLEQADRQYRAALKAWRG